MLILSALFSLALATPFAQDQQSAPPAQTRMPTYVSLANNLNSFGRFADSGPDENWYVGFNNAWIVQLPPAPIGDYTRAFIGAKLGRAKTRQRPGGRLWEREAIPGKIYMAISPVPAFTAERSFFLTETFDIPLEADSKTYVPGTGRSQWFWAEIPAGLVSFSGPNYLIIWSPTRYFVDASSSPVLAALEERGAAAEEPHAWNNRSLEGVAPRRQDGTLETPILNLKPALAIKLIPPNDASVTVGDCSARATDRDVVYYYSATGTGIDSTWLESSPDQIDWERFSPLLRVPPYEMTIPRGRLPARGAFVRAVARDQLGNEGSCGGVWVSYEQP